MMCNDLLPFLYQKERAQKDFGLAHKKSLKKRKIGNLARRSTESDLLCHWFIKKRAGFLDRVKACGIESSLTYKSLVQRRQSTPLNWQPRLLEKPVGCLALQTARKFDPAASGVKKVHRYCLGTVALRAILLSKT